MKEVFYGFITIMLLSINCNVFSEDTLSFERSFVGFSVSMKNGDELRTLTFGKQVKGSAITYIDYDAHPQSMLHKLKDEAKYIDTLWQLASDSLEIDIEIINIGYPLLFSDVLLTQIKAFQSSKEWQKFYRKYKSSDRWMAPNHELIRKVMLEGDVYGALSPILMKRGLKIAAYSIEKIGFITKAECKKHGIKWTNNLRGVPIPFILYVKLKKIE